MYLTHLFICFAIQKSQNIVNETSSRPHALCAVYFIEFRNVLQQKSADKPSNKESPLPGNLRIIVWNSASKMNFTHFLNMNKIHKEFCTSTLNF